MHRHHFVSRSPLLWMTVGVIGCSSPVAAGSAYVEIAAQDFVLVSAAGERRTREIATELLMFRAAMEATFGLRVNLAVPTRIHALSAADWRRIAPARRDVAGYFLPHAFASDLIFDCEAADPQVFELLFHEYTHHVLRSLAIGRYPAFFDEGLAEVFSTATFEDNVVRFKPRPEHVAYLRRRQWIPFDRLLAIARRDEEYHDHTLAPAFYAQAWATMYFAVASNSTFGNRLLDYIRDLNTGVPGDEAAEGLIGDTAARANAEIRAFIRTRGPLPVAELRIGGFADARTLRVIRLTAAQRDLALGELLLRMGSRDEAALALLRGAGGDAADRVRAAIGAGLVHLHADDRAGARRMLEAIHPSLDLPADQAVALGRALFQLAAGEEPGKRPEGPDLARLLKARELFGQSLHDTRTWVEATHGYVLANLALHEHDPSLLALAKKAYAAAPRNGELAVGIAILHELAGEKTLARRYWMEAARSVHEGPKRARILQRLSAGPTPLVGVSHD